MRCSSESQTPKVSSSTLSIPFRVLTSTNGPCLTLSILKCYIINKFASHLKQLFTRFDRLQGEDRELDLDWSSEESVSINNPNIFWRNEIDNTAWTVGEDLRSIQRTKVCLNQNSKICLSIENRVKNPPGSMTKWDILGFWIPTALLLRSAVTSWMPILHTLRSTSGSVLK